MAVEFVEITDLTEYLASDLDGNEPLQVSGTAFTTVGGIIDFGEKKYGSRPTILEIPWSFFSLNESSSSDTISNFVNSVAPEGWDDFKSKIRASNLFYSRSSGTVLSIFVVFNRVISADLTNSVSFIWITDSQLLMTVINYASRESTYTCKTSNYNISTIIKDIPTGSFKYQTKNVFDYPKPGDYILGIYTNSTSVINLKASDFLVANNHTCKVVVPANTTKVQVVTDNGIPPLMTDFAFEPSDLGGGNSNDRIVYTITAFASSNDPSSSQVWFFVDAEIYRLR